MLLIIWIGEKVSQLKAEWRKSLKGVDLLVNLGGVGCLNLRFFLALAPELECNLQLSYSGATMKRLTLLTIFFIMSSTCFAQEEVAYEALSQQFWTSVVELRDIQAKGSRAIKSALATIENSYSNRACKFTGFFCQDTLNEIVAVVNPIASSLNSDCYRTQRKFNELYKVANANYRDFTKEQKLILKEKFTFLETLFSNPEFRCYQEAQHDPSLIAMKSILGAKDSDKPAMMMNVLRNYASKADLSATTLNGGLHWLFSK